MKAAPVAFAFHAFLQTARAGLGLPILAGLSLALMAGTGLACGTPDEDSAHETTGERMNAEDATHKAARERMIRSQIMARGITDERLLQALACVERHRFIGPEYRAHAYEDYPLPIEAGQTISQPYIVALMTQLLELDGDEKILEIGTGSGYQAAILAELADTVFTIEIVDTLAQSARKLLAELGYTNIVIRSGDGYQGWPEEAPFDGIMVTCAPAEIPRPLLDQLAEGGRLVIPVGTRAQQLLLVEKRGGRLFEETVLPVRFVPMTGEGVEKR